MFPKKSTAIYAIALTERRLNSPNKSTRAIYACNAILCGLPAVILALIISGGCSKGPKSDAPETDPAKAGYDALYQYDDNSDSKISGPELDKAASLKSNLAKIDLDNDGAVTADEIADRIRYWQKTKLIRSRTPIHCTVYHNKQFLADAEVKLVPEKFLGDNVKIAKGKTNANGIVLLVMEDAKPNDPPGVGPGFYRVEITKKADEATAKRNREVAIRNHQDPSNANEEIPPKYNTKTILGLDTTMDNPQIRRGVRFDLEY
jgi:hypothetical protein